MPPSKTRVSVLIVDERRTFAEALQVALESRGEVRVLGVAVSGARGIRLAEEVRPQIVLVRIGSSARDGLATTRGILRRAPGTRVIGIADRPDELLLARALEAGAIGYLTTGGSLRALRDAVMRAARGEDLVSADQARRALRRLRHRRSEVAEGRSRADRLTARELEILQLMAEGMAPSAIAGALSMSPNTLRTHLQNVLTKLGVSSRLEAVTFALRHGKVRVPNDHTPR